MKRFSIIREFILCLNENDIAVFSNELMNKEAYQYDRNGNLYVNELGLALSLGLGIAIGTKKRVFVFCDDNDFMREMGTAAQISVSKCKNVIYVIFNNGCYQEAYGLPNIFREIYSPKGVLFNMGFRVHDYTHYFGNKVFKDEKMFTIKRIDGPLAIIIKTDKGIKKIDSDVISGISLKNRITDFIVNFK